MDLKSICHVVKHKRKQDALTKALQTVVPVTHEFGAYMFVPDLNLYHAIVAYYVNNVTDSYNHKINCGGKEFKFWSKQGGLVNPKTGKLAFEYLLKWQDVIGASKCFISIKPLFGYGTKTKTGKTLNLDKIGVNIEVKSSYMDLYDDILPLFKSLLGVFDARRFEDSIDFDQSYITQFARHIRYHETHESEVVRLLSDIKAESSMRGPLHNIDDWDGEGHMMYKLDLPAFDVCGIDTNFVHGIKSYRIKNYKKRDPTDPLRHPKLEVYFNPVENKRINKSTPTLNDFGMIKNDLDDLLTKLLNFMDPMIFVSDSYFDGTKTYKFRGNLPTWDRSKIQKNPDIDLPVSNLSAIKFLSYVALNKSGFVNFTDIVKYTQIPERSAWRYLNLFRSLNILDCMRDSQTRVFFKSISIWNSIKDALIILSRFIPLGFKSMYGYIFSDSTEIRAYKDRYKNLSPIFQHNSEVVFVKTDQDAKRLQSELLKLGIRRKIAIA